MVLTMYDSLFQPKEHFLTVRHRDGKPPSRRKLFNGKQLKKAVRHQEPNTDLYVTKYASSMAVYTIILDFDSTDKEEAYRDVLTLHKYLQTKGIKSVIVDSTNKGYHIYIQIKPVGFQLFDDPNLMFTIFVEHLIYNQHFRFATLDEANMKASLKGNIRVIGSVHPVTNEKVEIVKGKFVPFLDDELYDTYISKMSSYQDICYQNALRDYKETQQMKKQIKQSNIEYSMSSSAEFDPLKLDLREVFKEVFSLDKVRESGGNLWCCCPFHNDSNPSFLVTEDFYVCKSCGAKGNAWTLIKEGYWKPFKNDEGTGYEIGKGELR